MTTKTTYKVGDKVRILDAKKIKNAVKDGFKSGEVYPVTRIYDDGRPVIEHETDFLAFFQDELKYIEKVEESDAKMTQFKVGDKVRVIADEGDIAGVKIGTIATVTGVDSDGDVRLDVINKNGVPAFFLAREVELVTPKQTKNQRISTLEQKVEAMQAEIDTLKAAQKLDEVAETFGIKRQHAAPKSTPNEQRKAIIDEAKAFLEEVEREQNDSKVRDKGNAFHRQYLTKTEFIVNAEKRTVVAIIRTKYGTTLLTKAIAKCAPSDVFNEHIGKAIALGRALGLDVSKFEKAVQPSEVVVGMVVNRVNIDGDDLGPLKVETVRKLGERDYKTYKTNTHEINESFGYGVEHGDKIIDDTEAQY